MPRDVMSRNAPPAGAGYEEGEEPAKQEVASVIMTQKASETAPPQRHAESALRAKDFIGKDSRDCQLAESELQRKCAAYYLIGELDMIDQKAAKVMRNLLGESIGWNPTHKAASGGEYLRGHRAAHHEIEATVRASATGLTIGWVERIITEIHAITRVGAERMTNFFVQRALAKRASELEGAGVGSGQAAKGIPPPPRSMRRLEE